MQTQLSFHSSKKNASPIWIIFLLHFVVLLVSSDNSLKVCTKDGQVHQVSAVSCNKGAWTSETVEVDCVCATGIWILSEKYCDEDFHVIASRENECFKINKPVRKSYFTENPLFKDQGFFYKRGHFYHFNGDLQSFHEFEDNFTVSNPPKNSYLIRFNDTESSLYLRHEEGVSPKFWQKCFKPSKTLDTVQVIKSGKASFISSTDDCDLLRETKFGYGKNENSNWELEVGSSWHSKYGIERVSDSCMETCGSKKAVPQGRAMNRAGDVNSSSSPAKKDGQSEDSVEYVKSEDNYDLYPEDDMGYNDTDVFTERMLDNGRDTVRVTHYLKKWIVHNIPGPHVVYKEYKYMQLARIIFLKSCPDVDGQTLTNFIRIFRFLIYETFRKFPDKYSATTDLRVHERIVENLRKCFADVTPYTLEYDEKACPEAGGSQPITSVVDPKGTKYASIIRANSAEELQFKIGRDSDTALETAWKIMLHAHYQCSDHFKDHPDDLSTMYVKLQEFLISPRIIFRWENPGEYLNQVYGFLHPGFQLEKFAKTVDACVNAAKESSFFKEWLRRPKDRQDYNKQSVMGRSMALFGAKGKGTPTLFAGQGYCVNKFEDPLVWTSIDKSVNAKCQNS